MKRTIEIPLWQAVAVIAGLVLLAAVSLRRCAEAQAVSFGGPVPQ